MTPTPPVEITVKIKGSDSSYRQKFLEYNPVSCDTSNEAVRLCVQQAKEAYNGDVEEISVTCKWVWE